MSEDRVLFDDRFQDDDPYLRRLVRSEGECPPLPAGALRAAEVAARGAWQGYLTARRRRRTRNLALGAALAAGIVLALSWGLIGPAERPVTARDTVAPAWDMATLEHVVGAITVSDGSQVLEAGRPLAVGELISTGPDGHAAMRLAGGCGVRIDHGSAVRFRSAKSLYLERGALYVDSGPGEKGDGGIEVWTPLGLAREMGTQFEVRLLANERTDDPHGLQIRVREGEVALHHDSETYSTREGGQLTIHTDGAVERTDLPPYAAEWDWVQVAAAPFEIEGASLIDLLEWVGRETGRQWRFSEAELREEAKTIILHGSAHGLTAQETLELVLPGCRLRSRTAQGVLWIEKDDQ